MVVPRSHGGKVAPMHPWPSLPIVVFGDVITGDFAIKPYFWQ
jgi:hypothetical protein